MNKIRNYFIIQLLVAVVIYWVELIKKQEKEIVYTITRQSRIVATKKRATSNLELIEYASVFENSNKRSSFYTINLKKLNSKRIFKIYNSYHDAYTNYMKILSYDKNKIQAMSTIAV